MFTFQRETDIDRERKPESCFVIDRLSMVKDGEQAGYLKISNVPSMDFWQFLNLQNALMPNTEQKIWDIQDPENKYHMAYQIAQYARIERSESNSIAAQARECDNLYRFLCAVRVIDRLLERHDATFRRYHDYFVQRPFVDFVKIHRRFNGHNHSIRLYKEAAKWLKERHLRLRLSHIASPAALHIREKMKKRNMLEPIKVTWYNKTSTAYLLK